MIHGIYQKSRPTGSWHLVSIAASPEAANFDYTQILNQAKLDGNDKIEVVIQTFDSAFYIPELLNKVKEQKLLYN